MGDARHTGDPPEGDAKIGPILEQARRERGLTLEEAEQATKIRKRYLAGLEREDFGVLPGAVYAQGFLKTYANFLGLDGEDLSRQLKDLRRPRRERGVTYGAPSKSDFEEPLIIPGGLAGTEKRRISGATIVTVVVALVAFAAVIGTLYYVGQNSGAAGGNPGATSGERPDSGQERSEANDDGATPQVASGDISDETPKDGATEDGVQEDGVQEAAVRNELPENALRIVVSVEGAPSWLRVRADGSVALEEIAQPGFSRTFEATRVVSVKTGDAGAVSVEVNGQDVGVLGADGEVVSESWAVKSAS